MPMVDPFTVIVRLTPGTNLGETMNRLRSWLDKEKIQIVEFKTNVVASGHTFSVGFSSIEAADRFRRQFVSPSGQAHIASEPPIRRTG